MYGIRRIIFLVILLTNSINVFAEEKHLVEHLDSIEIQPELSLKQLIESTLEKYPEHALKQALTSEAQALQKRGKSWLAGSMSLSARYQDDIVADDEGAREIETELELPLWNWGQRDAGLAVAEQAKASIDKQSALITLQVAGLIRQALWDMSLENIRYQQAKAVLDISATLLSKVKRRVELGDLPRFDLLLAQSDHLEKRSLLVQAEAEMMHARKRYITLTQSNKIPADFSEMQSKINAIESAHPVLIAINAQIERLKSEVEWVKAAGSGQPTFTVGGKSERGNRHENNSESMSFAISIPFGGEAHLAPEIAAVNLELTELLVQRQHLHRHLEQALHEAEHDLEVTTAELKMAQELKKIAKQHLKMTQLSFSAGEINLLDVLKIQTKAHNALRHAKEHQVMLQRNIALYNQAVGVHP